MAKCIKDIETGVQYITDMGDKVGSRSIIAIDVDGVIYDIIKALNKSSSMLGLIPLYDNILSDYAFNVYPEWVRTEIFKCFKGESIWQYEDCFYDNAFDFLRVLVNSIDKSRYAIVLHTMVPTRDGATVRYSFLNYLLHKKDLSADVSVCVDIGYKRVMSNSVIIIDDYLDNIERSTAPIKIVPVHRYNTYKNVNACLQTEQGTSYYSVTSYYSLLNAFYTLYAQLEQGKPIDYAEIEYVPVNETCCFSC